MPKFVFILACLAIALASYPLCRNKKDWAWLACGLTFTVIADYFLILRQVHLTGVAVFCMVHVCYILRVKRGYMVWLAILAQIAIIILFNVGSLYLLASFYAVLFIANIAINLKWRKKNRATVLAALLLFALCDINVAIFNLHPTNGIAFTLIWVFYLPSQLVLALSAVSWCKTKTIPTSSS